MSRNYAPLNLKCNKRGNAFTDTIVIIVFLFAFAIISVSAFLFASQVNTEIQADADMSPEAKAAMNTITVDMPNTLDSGFLTFLVLIWIVAIVASFKIDTHPIFFIFAFLLLAFTIYVGAELSNTYQEIMADTDYVAYAASFPIQNYIMSNYVTVVLIIAFSIMLSLFAKVKWG